MKDKFIAWFDAEHPGMVHDSETFRDEFRFWMQAYITGMDRAIEIFNAKPSVHTAQEPYIPLAVRE